jgi:hypothetical protein
LVHDGADEEFERGRAAAAWWGRREDHTCCSAEVTVLPFKKILVAIDGSPGGQKALETAIELTQLTRASLHALTVEGSLPAYAAIGEVDETKRERDAFFGTIVK